MLKRALIDVMVNVYFNVYLIAKKWWQQALCRGGEK